MMFKKLTVGLFVFLLMTSYSKIAWSDDTRVIHEITTEARSHGLDPALTLAIAENESDFKPEAKRFEPTKHVWTWGIFQLMVDTARSVGFSGTVKELRTPEVNIRYGVLYLASCQETVGPKIEAMACCHNAGIAATPRVCHSAPVQKYSHDIAAGTTVWRSYLQDHGDSDSRPNQASPDPRDAAFWFPFQNVSLVQQRTTHPLE